VGWYPPEALPEPLTPRTTGLLARAAEQAVTGRTWFPT